MANYPGAASSDANLYIAKNFLFSTLNGAVDAVTTTIVLADASAFPTAGFVVIGTEAISYTGKSTNTLTGVVRGADGTTAATHANGATALAGCVAAHHNVLKDEVIALETDLVPKAKWTASSTNSVNTTDATATNVLTYTLPDETLVGVRAEIFFRVTGGSAGNTGEGGFAWNHRGAYRTGAGSAVLLDTTNGSNSGYWAKTTDGNSLVPTFTWSVSGNDLKLSVTGKANTNVTWRCKFTVFTVA